MYSFACFHIQYLSPIYCGKIDPTAWEKIPYGLGKYSLILWENFPSIYGNTFPQYMEQSRVMSIFKQKATILSKQ